MRLVLSSTFTWPVTVEIPGNNGKYDRQQFTAEFKRLGTSDYEQMLDGLRDGQRTDKDVANDVLVGWQGIQDELGNDLLFTRDNRDQLLEIPSVLRGVVAAFIDASTGGARRKN